MALLASCAPGVPLIDDRAVLQPGHGLIVVPLNVQSKIYLDEETWVTNLAGANGSLAFVSMRDGTKVLLGRKAKDDTLTVLTVPAGEYRLNRWLIDGEWHDLQTTFRIDVVAGEATAFGRVVLVRTQNAWHPGPERLSFSVEPDPESDTNWRAEYPQLASKVPLVQRRMSSDER